MGFVILLNQNNLQIGLFGLVNIQKDPISFSLHIFAIY